MANIYDVARQAKVSTATVSKVISNTPYVSEPTRQRVLQAIVELGYSPRLAARSLTGNRTFVIGLAIPYEPNYLFSDPFLLQIIQGIEETANERDYNLLLSTARHSNPQSAYNRLLNTGYVDGVIILETSGGKELDRKLQESGMPRVSLGYPLTNSHDNDQESGGQAVHSDDYDGALQATRHLLALGHRRIGVINGPANLMVAMEERLRGYRDGLKEFGLTFDPALMVYGDYTLESGYPSAQKLLKLDPRPTAIFSFNDRMAVGALRYAREQGLRVPQDLSLIGFDDIELARASDPALTTIRQLAVEMGQTAALRLFNQINNERDSHNEVVLPIEFIIRSSTGPVTT